MRTGILGSSAMTRSLTFALTGILWFGSWVVPASFEMAPSTAKWLVVLLFSASLLTLAVALRALGRMVGGRHVVRWASIAAASAGLCSVANVFEDGFVIDAFFYVFVVGLLSLDFALLALTIALALTAPGRSRPLALIAAGTLAGILAFPMVGGPVMLVTWLGAAAAAVAGGRWPALMPATPPSS